MKLLVQAFFFPVFRIFFGGLQTSLLSSATDGFRFSAIVLGF